MPVSYHYLSYVRDTALFHPLKILKGCTCVEVMGFHVCIGKVDLWVSSQQQRFRSYFFIHHLVVVDVDVSVYSMHGDFAAEG